MAFLTRSDPAKNLYRFYVVKLAPTLFGGWTFIARVGPQRITRHCARHQL